MDFCFQYNIYLCFLPAHTSHGLQPADSGYFAVMKRAFRKELDKLNSLNDAAPIDKLKFVRCMYKARKAVSRETVQKCWSHTGQWPINREKALNHPEIQPDEQEKGQKRKSVEPDEDKAED